MKGLSIPIGVTGGGGAATVTGDAQDQKIISIALASDSNENAFQQNIGMGNEAIYQDSNERIQAKINMRLKKIFAYFESQHRFRLLTETIRWTRDSATQEMFLEFHYLNIESDALQPFKKSYSTA